MQPHNRHGHANDWILHKHPRKTLRIPDFSPPQSPPAPKPPIRFGHPRRPSIFAAICNGSDRYPYTIMKDLTILTICILTQQLFAVDRKCRQVQPPIYTFICIRRACWIGMGHSWHPGPDICLFQIAPLPKTLKDRDSLKRILTGTPSSCSNSMQRSRDSFSISLISSEKSLSSTSSQTSR